MWRIAGQDTARKALERAIAQGVTSHSYFFTGPKGVGKTTAAFDFAAALNCKGVLPPCFECDSCRRIAAGNHPDFMIVGEEGTADGVIREISIDSTREMQRWAAVLPFEGRFRVFVLVECERLSDEAANSLLKVVEEPPPHVVFILTSRLEEAVLPTIKSRCQQVPFTRLPASEIATLLETRHGLSAEEGQKLSKLSFGRPGWAVTAVQRPEVLEARERKLREIEAMATGSLLDRFSRAARMAREFQESRTDVYATLDLMIEWWRDLLLHRLELPQQRTINGPSPGTVSVFEARDLSVEELTSFIHKLIDTKNLLADNINPQLALESLVTEMPRL